MFFSVSAKKDIGRKYVRKDRAKAYRTINVLKIKVTLQIVYDPIVSANILNEHLERFHQWASKWLVTFNHTKTEIITFSAEINKIVHPQPFLPGNVLKEVTHHTPFSNDCSWSNLLKL